ncbi:MAG: 3-oxoacyl-ACP synthase, partial [Moorea sp. SIO3G5]|nr:3-oxoacyl-ACP synthase [Moorena sp. SIO3G5]
QEAVQLSWDTLEKVGNMSSSSVLYILNEVLSQEQPSAGSYGLMVGMGPGLSQEILLLQW